MSPDDIPVSVTQLVYTAPWVDSQMFSHKLSRNQIAEQLAHYWPAIEQHIREQVAQEIAATAAAHLNGHIDRPRYERGGYLNDWQWAEQVARGTNQPATEES